MKSCLVILLLLIGVYCQFTPVQEVEQGLLADSAKRDAKFLAKNNQKVEGDIVESGSSDSTSQFVGVFFGVILFILSFPVLWYNERRYVITKYRIQNAFKSCVPIDSNEVNLRCEGHLVHLNGQIKTDDKIYDPIFKVSVTNCVKLIRKVEVLQWVESSSDINKRKHYYYHMEWQSHHVDSGNFNYSSRHYNDPRDWIVQNQTHLARTVNLGSFQLNESQKQKINRSTQVDIQPYYLQEAQNQFSRSHQFIFQDKEYIMMKRQLHESQGDIRISFQRVPCNAVTIVAQQTGRTFQPWAINDIYTEKSSEGLQETGLCSCCCQCIKSLESPITEIDWVFEDIMRKDQAFNEKMNENAMATTCIRLLGWLMMSFGLILIFSPISLILELLPFIGAFLAALSGCLFCILSFCISIPFSLITISIAWIYYRPLLAIMLLFMACCLGAFIFLIASSMQ